MAIRSLLPMEAAVTEMLVALSVFVALVWVIVRAVLMLVRVDGQDSVPALPADPISTYVDENYGSHFVDDPVTVRRGVRRS
jgi:hypothetical protein